MSFYTTVSAQYQIDELEGFQLKNDLEFFYSLFFKSQDLSREHLLQKGLCVLFVSNGLINCGNKENIPLTWEEKTYDEFRSEISGGT